MHLLFIAGRISIRFTSSSAWKSPPRVLWPILVGFHRQVASLLETQIQFYIKSGCNFCNGFDPFWVKDSSPWSRWIRSMKEEAVSTIPLWFVPACMEPKVTTFNRIDISTHDRLDLGNKVKAATRASLASCGKACPHTCKGNLDFTGSRKG